MILRSLRFAFPPIAGRNGGEDDEVASLAPYAAEEVRGEAGREEA